MYLKSLFITQAGLKGYQALACIRLQDIQEHRERNAFNGLALVIVRALPGKAGEIKVTAKAGNLPPAQMVLRSR